MTYEEMWVKESGMLELRISRAIAILEHSAAMCRHNLDELHNVANSTMSAQDKVSSLIQLSGFVDHLELPESYD